MELAKLVLSIVTVAVAVTSFMIAKRADARAKRAEAIRNLLGEKETVAFAALKLLRDGLPQEQSERNLVLAAILQACVFEASSRARALLYRVIEQNRVKYRAELRAALGAIDETFKSMDGYHFSNAELDLGTGKKRLEAVDRVVSEP